MKSDPARHLGRSATLDRHMLGSRWVLDLQPIEGWWGRFVVTETLVRFF